MTKNTIQKKNYIKQKHWKETCIVPYDLTWYWLNKRPINELYILSHREYNSLPLYWRNEYSLEDSTKNLFVVDYIFQKLLEYDKKNIIQPQMFRSFCQLAKKTSLHNLK